MLLLDTMIVSELRKSRPNANVVRWLSKQAEDEIYLSVVTLGEIERGIEKCRKTDPEFATVLSAWTESLVRHYSDRILPVTTQIACRWGRLSAQMGHENADLLLAATALTHKLTVVTRNTDDFAPTGVRLINPFER